MNNTTSIVSKVWNFCHTLRDDGVSYGEYLEQLTYLLFLKMADEYAKPPYNRKSNIPKAYNWESLSEKKGAELEEHYVKLLRELGQKSGMLGQIFFKAQNRIQDPAKLFKIIDMIDRENWVMMGADVKGEIYEGLLEKNAEDVKSGAGQYFTPRPLIRAMVECLRPEPRKTISDPACGTGGFFLATYDFLNNQQNYRLDKAEKEFLKFKTFRGWEIVPDTYRLCLMNLFLHNIGDMESEPPITRNDSLIADSGERFDFVMTNPPFGKKSSMTFTNEEGEQEREDLTYNRQDFWATTSNKQLNFVQHIPENRHKRKPTWSEKNSDGRWRKFTYDEIIARDKTSLDIFWLKDESLADLDHLPDPDVLAGEIVENLEAGLESFREIVGKLNS